MVVAIFDCGQSLRLRRIGVHCVLVYWDELDKRPGAGSGGRTFSTLFDYLLFTSHTTILGTIHDLQVIFSTSQHHQQVVHRRFFQFFDVVVVGDLFFFFLNVDLIKMSDGNVRLLGLLWSEYLQRKVIYTGCMFVIYKLNWFHLVPMFENGVLLDSNKN